MAVDPGTRSPGKLYLIYSVDGLTHRAGLNFIDGVDIEDISAARADATAFAAVFKGVIPTTASISGWGVAPAGMSVGYEEPFSPVIAGTHATSGPAMHSRTGTMSGNGVATTVAGAKGKTRLVFVGSNAFPPVPGLKKITNSTDASLVALANYLHTNLRMFADFYGQHAEPKTYITVQFNAKLQRTQGD